APTTSVRSTRWRTSSSTATSSSPGTSSSTSTSWSGSPRTRTATSPSPRWWTCAPSCSAATASPGTWSRAASPSRRTRSPTPSPRPGSRRSRVSEQATEQEALTLGADPAAQMAQVLDFLAPGAFSEEAGEGGEEAPAAPDEPGQQPAEDQGAGAPGGDAGAPDDGDGGEPPAPDGGGAPAGDTLHTGPGPGAGDLDADSLKDDWGRLATSFETTQAEALKNAALAEVREEHAKYFEHISQHPRLLVGKEVPSPTGNGMEVQRDSADAKEWQEAVKHLLVEEHAARAEKKKDELADASETG